MRHFVDVHVAGGLVSAEVSGPPSSECVLLHPSLGRGARDFDALVAALVDAGYRTVAFDPRGAGRSAASSGEVDMRQLAADVVAVLDELGHHRAHLVGHAFGNRVVRSVATLHGERVATVALIGAGGRVPGDDEARAALVRCFDLSLPTAERLESIATAFFAPGGAPAAWADGWYVDAYVTQGMAARGPIVENWWEAGGAPMLIVQGLQDRVAPPANGRALVAGRGHDTELVEIDGAGHALLPEQPDQLAEALVGFLRRHPITEG